MRETLTVREVAERLGVAPETVRRYIEEKRLDAYQLTPGMPRSPWRVTVKSIEEFEQQRKRQLGGQT